MTHRIRSAARLLAPTLFAAILILTSAPAVGQIVSSVKGTVKDTEGQPMPKVQVFFETVEVEGRGSGILLGKVKTRKDGTYTYPFLEPGSYKIYPQLEGYSILHVDVISIDSQKDVRLDQEFIIGRDQANLPPVPVAPQGRGAVVNGRCNVDFIVVKDEDFSAALARLQRGESASDTPAPKAAPTVSRKQDPVERGDEYFAAKDFAQAATAYQEAVEQDPERADAYLSLGRALLKSDDLAGAQGALMQAARLDPELPGANFYLATIYNDLAQTDAAIAALEKERIISPDTDQVLVNLGSLYRDTNQPRKALEVLGAVVELDPENTDAFLAMADVYNHLGETQKAEEIYRQILSVNPGQEDIIWYNIGVNAFNANNREEAASAFEKSIEANPKNPDSHWMLGLTLMGLGNTEGAVTHFKAYKKLEPKGQFIREVNNFLDQMANS